MTLQLLENQFSPQLLHFATHVPSSVFNSQTFPFPLIDIFSALLSRSFSSSSEPFRFRLFSSRVPGPSFLDVARLFRHAVHRPLSNLFCPTRFHCRRLRIFSNIFYPRAPFCRFGGGRRSPAGLIIATFVFLHLTYWTSRISSTDALLVRILCSCAQSSSVLDSCSGTSPTVHRVNTDDPM